MAQVLRRGHLANLELVTSRSGRVLVRKAMAARSYLYNHLYVFQKISHTRVVPSLYGYSDSELTLFYEYVDGLHLDEIEPSSLESCYFAAGLSLAKFHSHSGHGFGETMGERETGIDWWELQDRRVQQLLSDPHVDRILGAAMREALARRYNSLRAAVQPEWSSCLCHGDFRPDNLLFVRGSQGWRCIVLDFDHASLGAGHLDFGRVALDLFDAWPGSREPFLRGYSSVRPLPELAATLPIYRILWPLMNLAWGCRNGAETLVTQSAGALRQTLEG